MSDLIVIRFRAGGDPDNTTVLRIDETGQETVLSTHPLGAGRVPEGVDRALQAEISAGYRNVVLDMEGVPWVSSEGVGHLIGLHRLVTEAGGRVAVIGLSTRMKDVLATTKLDMLFHCCDTLTEARKYFSEREANPGA